MSGDAVLAELIRLVDRRVRWYYTPLAEQRGVTSWKEHAETIEAISHGDQRRAAEAMRPHTEETRAVSHEHASETDTVAPSPAADRSSSASTGTWSVSCVLLSRRLP